MINNLSASQIEQAFGVSGVVLEFLGENPIISAASGNSLEKLNARLKRCWENGSLVSKCSQRQLRLWLLSKGLLSTVESAIKSASQAVQIEWEYAAEFKRNHPAIEAIGAICGLSASQIDTAFEETAEI